MIVNFKILDRDIPFINIKGFVDLENVSNYCLYFYERFGDVCFRIPLNPYKYYSDDYIGYEDLVYAFRTDEEFMPILKKFEACEHDYVKIQRPHYDLVLKKRR